MNKIPHLVKVNKLNIENQHCIIINPVQKYLKKVITKYDEQEISNLAKNINLIVKYQQNIKIRKPTPSHFFGKGQVSNFKIFLDKYSSRLLLINCQISAVQQRNLELSLNCKILDRTGLILEIFGERAVTKHGQLQVELASLSYQKSRLVRSWTHLERQRGGAGFMGGPGETQIESDKRQINNKIFKLKKELKKIELNRSEQRKQRNKSSIPVISLVGYTNVGKSALFNYLAKENIFVKNQLFATLDTTMRKVNLISELYIILSDTVGFISDLPTQLITSFKTTLEEINFSNYIIHVIDISNPDWESQKKIVLNTLKDILKDN